MTREEKLNKIMKSYDSVLEKIVLGQADEGLSPTMHATIITITKEAATETLKEYYDEVFTDQDLDNLITWSESETGQKSHKMGEFLTAEDFQKKMLKKSMVKLKGVLST